MLLRAADLLAGPWRARVNAATMIGQGKTIREAEIDAAAELADFWRFNVYFAQQLGEVQPISPPGFRNRLEQRGLEGFVYAVTPFNFTAIGGNLPTAPALMGNTVVWKPSQTAILSNWFVFQILREAGMPDGVINFVPGDPGPITEVCLDHPEFAGVHFTGSSAVFRSLFREVGERIDRYKSYPRLVGETGGKDFVVMHASADPQEVAVALVRGSFEYQGQKCSAASRAYIPDTLWPDVRDRALAMVGEIHQGDPADLTTFMGAVIDGRAFARLREAFDMAESSSSARILCGGGVDDSVGWFVEPTIIETSDPHYDTMERELFGPCLTVYPYPEARYAETLELCDGTSPYALTGSIFARDRARDRARPRQAAPRGGQLLRQRQAHGRRRRPAAVRRRPRLGHERQGRLVEQPDALVVAAHGQGDIRPAARHRRTPTWSPTAPRDGRERGVQRRRRARRRLPRARRRRATGRAHARGDRPPEREGRARAHRARRGRRGGLPRRELRARRRGARRRRRGRAGRSRRRPARGAAERRGDRRAARERARDLVPAAARPARDRSRHWPRAA